MGNYVDKYLTDKFINETSHHVMCRECSKLATYRCSVVNADTYDSVEYPWMNNYLYKVITDGSDNYTYYYTACSNCVGEFHDVYTFYPNGWKENDKVHCNYELAKLD